MKILISHWQNQSYQQAQSDETKQDGFQDICYECALEMYTKHYPEKNGFDQLADQAWITKKLF